MISDPQVWGLCRANKLTGRLNVERLDPRYRLQRQSRCNRIIQKNRNYLGGLPGCPGLPTWCWHLASGPSKGAIATEESGLWLQFLISRSWAPPISQLSRLIKVFLVHESQLMTPINTIVARQIKMICQRQPGPFDQSGPPSSPVSPGISKSNMSSASVPYR